jgi:hypothetical protein
MKPRIHRNVWDNWNGYLGSRRVIEFGMDGQDAREWLARMEAMKPEDRATNYQKPKRPRREKLR